jgi:hypothetical protein
MSRAVSTNTTRPFIFTTRLARQLDCTALSLALMGAFTGTLMLICNDQLLTGAKLAHRLVTSF